MASEGPQVMHIGRVLKDARTRARLDVRTVEERTKIRVKYLRALEDEQWDVLPSHAYAKGFLRTYAQLLGLDGEALVDEFRRQVDTGGGDEPTYPLGDKLLERRRRPGEVPGGGLGWRAVLIAAAVVVVGVLLVIGLVGGDDDGGADRDARAKREAKQERREQRRDQERRRERQAATEPSKVALELAITSPVSVCLLGADDEELIDGQVLAAGTSEGPFNAERFELRFPTGYDRDFFELRLAGERVRVPETQGPTAFRISPPAKLRRAPEPGLECP